MCCMGMLECCKSFERISSSPAKLPAILVRKISFEVVKPDENKSAPCCFYALIPSVII